MLFALFLLLAQPSAPADAASLRIEFANLRKAKGSLRVAVYNSQASYMDTGKACHLQVLRVTSVGTLVMDIKDLPAGSYAVSCFHDLNDNGELDTNLLGIPSEPYGASNNARPKFRAPNWAETRFDLPSAGRSLTIKLEKW
jgi:uncharacterized protein (DUF2141 family)